MGLPDVLDADSFLVCEVVTPAGNWSSWPPHKHDEERPGEETELEEIYYVETRSTDPRGTDPVGYLRVYGSSDAAAARRRRRGAHRRRRPRAPRLARPGGGRPDADLYYLNVMAGPGPERAWRICDDPAHAWVRESWADEPVDPRLPLGGTAMTAPETVRLTVAQAVVRFLAQQWTERDGERQRLFAGCLGIFGHGNVAGIGQALLEDELRATEAGEEPGLRYVLGRNEQAMVHTAVGYAKQPRPALDVGGHRVGRPGLDEHAHRCGARDDQPDPGAAPAVRRRSRPGRPRRCSRSSSCRHAGDVTVNDAFRPLSRFFDEVTRPEQLPAALLGACRVLTDPAETGAATISLPQDVQAEAFDWPVELFAERVWHVRPPAGRDRPGVADVADAVRSAERPAASSPAAGSTTPGAEAALAAFAAATGIPVAETQAGKGSLPHGHPQLVGAVGSTGTTAANALAAEADLVIGVGTRWTDFTTASRTAFQDERGPLRQPQRRRDRRRQAQRPRPGRRRPRRPRGPDRGARGSPRRRRLRRAHRRPVVRVGRARRGGLRPARRGHRRPRRRACSPRARCSGSSTSTPTRGTSSSARPARCPATCTSCGGCATARATTSSTGTPAWATRSPAPSGSALADDTRDVFAMVGDGGYLMMPTELVVAVQERVKIVVVLVQNHGFHSIGSLSEGLGSQRFGTSYEYRGAGGRLDGGHLPVDLAANARSLGAHVVEVHSRDELVGRAWPTPGPGRGTAGRSSSTSRPTRGCRALERVVVGRPGGAGLGDRLHAGGRRRLPRGQAAPATLPRPDPPEGDPPDERRTRARGRRRRRPHGHRPRPPARRPGRRRHPERGRRPRHRPGAGARGAPRACGPSPTRSSSSPPPTSTPSSSPRRGSSTRSRCWPASPPASRCSARSR